MKKFKLNHRLSEDTDYYELEPIVRYADYLEEQGRVVRVGNVLFDADAMRIPFTCDSQLCVGPKGPKKGNCCCSVYTPRLSTSERQRIDEILPDLRRRFPVLDRTLAKLDSAYYEWDDEYNRMMLKGKKDLCVFMTQDTKEFGFHACMIHAWCLENRLNPAVYKPSACIMFPIYLLDMGDEEGTMMITANTREVALIGEESDEYYFDVPCLKPNKSGGQPLYIAMKDTLVEMFGIELWDRLDRLMVKWIKANSGA